MRRTTLGILLCAVVLQGCEDRGPDSVDTAREANRDNTAVSSDAARFLVEMADARMMDAREGEVARDRAVNADVRAYGEMMVRDQAVLLEEIRQLAAAKGIELPATISNEKAAGLEDLASQEGEDLDSKFISMICIDHERDVGRFRDATRLDDPEVRAFAERRLPMIEQHLAEAKALDELH